MTLKGTVYYPSYAGIRVGTENNRIPLAQQAIIYSDNPVV